MLQETNETSFFIYRQIDISNVTARNILRCRILQIN